MITRFNRAVIGTVVCTVLSVAQIQAQTNQYRSDRILVKPSVSNINTLNAQLGTRVLRSYPNIGNIQVIQLPDGMTVPQAIAQYQNSGQVAYAEPDYLVQATVTSPNDPKYTDGTLWGFNNNGQNGAQRTRISMLPRAGIDERQPTA